MALQINKEFFLKRATRIYEAWNEDVDLLTINALVFMVPNNLDTVQYSKLHAIQTWLFNCSLPDTLLVMTKSGIYFLGSDKKAQFFSSIVTKDKENFLSEHVPSFTTFNRNKGDKDKENFEKFLNIISEVGRNCGYFAKDKMDSEFAKSWQKAMKEREYPLIDVSLPFAKIFAVKENDEIELLRKASLASVNLWNNYLKKKIIEIVDTERKVRHNKLTEETENNLNVVSVQGNLVPERSKHLLESCYTPIIQSGDQILLKFNAESNEKVIHYGSITCSLGVRYSSYCSNLGRTVMVMPSKLLEDLYEALLTTELTIIENLKPGRQICEAFDAGLKHFESLQPNYSQYLVKNYFGFATGIEFREANLLINEKCKQTVKTNMTFIIALGLQNFPNKANKDDSVKAASIFLSDTVLVCNNGPNEILTEKAKNRLRSNSIRFREEVNEKEVVESSTRERAKRSVILQEQTRHKQTNEEKRKERQNELLQQLNEEARQRLSVHTGGNNAQKKIKSNVSYKSDDKFPDETEVERLMIYVDKRNDSVIVPIFGIPVPFHISMIKNASHTTEGDYTCLRINFTHPGSQIGKENASFSHPLAKFVKEMSFKSSSVREFGQTDAPSQNLSTALRLIKEMQKRFRTMEAEECEKEGAIKQDKLILSTGKGNPKLKELYVRPNIIAKRISGVLEAHVNGFRYTSLRGDKIDVLYNNIKHAFFQPCDNEIIILLHFHLKYPVLWGKKKYSDIQFYTEVGEITTDLNKYHHMQDRDDIQSEQIEREMRQKLNLAFQNFCDKVVRLTNKAVDFDTPFSELGFSGVPYRSTVTLKPTSSCLINVTEWPPFIITLDEVEVVHFERVTGNTRTFDMVIVFKDYHKKVHQVGQIPALSLDNVKDWLNSCDIRYSEGAMSLNWANIMKTIVDNPQAFFDDGGWKFLDQDSDGEDVDEESDSESAFSPSNDDESDVSDEDEEDESAEATSESESDASLDSNESEGKDWSDLEKEAERADKAKDINQHEELSSRKRKSAVGSGSNAKRRR